MDYGESQSETSLQQKNVHIDSAVSEKSTLAPDRDVKQQRCLKCVECEYKSGSAYNLKRHMMKHTKKYIACAHCSAKCFDMYALKTHLRLKHGSVNDKLACQHCSKLYMSRQGLNAHIKLKHKRDGRFSCSTCNKQFRDSSAYSGHMNSHMNKRSHTCNLCKKTFVYETSARRHQVECHRDTEFKCTICKGLYKSLRTLKEHTQAKHSSNSSMSCACGKTFIWRKCLSRHQISCRKDSWK